MIYFHIEYPLHAEQDMMEDIALQSCINANDSARDLHLYVHFKPNRQSMIHDFN